MKMRKLFRIAVAVMTVIACSFMLSSCGEGDNMTCEIDDLNQIAIGGKVKELKSGDKLHADVWGEATYTFNDKEYHKAPVLYDKITIGSNEKDILKAFKLKPGYALVNREISTPEHDGTTDIVEETYKNMDFWKKESVLDADFTWGYKLVDGKWELIKAKDIDKAKLVYSVDFVGDMMASDVSVEERQVVAINVEMK